MTRAAALALRTAGTLNPNCVVVITDGPTIGTAGNTSATQIELNPVSGTDLGLTARVHTTFDNSAWSGTYDVDLGVAGSITELTDGWGNTVKDVDADSPTVQTQFPWHLGSATLRDNYVEDSVLPGWDTQVGSLVNNRVVGSTIDLTGKTAGTWQDNEMVSTFVAVAANTGMQRNLISGATLADPAFQQSGGAGTATIVDSKINGGMSVVHSGAGTLSVNRCELTNSGTGPNGSISHAGGGSLTLSACICQSTTGAGFFIEIQAGSTGAVTLVECIIRRAVSSNITKVAGSSGPLPINNVDFDAVTITVGAANAAVSNTFANVIAQGCTFTLNGPVAGGRNDFTSGILAQLATVNVAATATAGAAIQGGSFTGTFNQNRTAGTVSTTLFEPDARGSTTVVDNGTTDPTVGIGLSRVRLVDSAVNIGNISAKTGTGTVLQQSELVGSTLTLTGLAGAALVNRLRMLGAVLVNAGFAGDNLVLESNLSKTMGAAQNNRHGSIVFDNWV